MEENRNVNGSEVLGAIYAPGRKPSPKRADSLQAKGYQAHSDSAKMSNSASSSEDKSEGPRLDKLFVAETASSEGNPLFGPPASILPPTFDKALPAAPIQRKKTLSERFFSKKSISGHRRSNSDRAPSNGFPQKKSRDQDINWENDSNIEFGKPSVNRFRRLQMFIEQYPFWMQSFLLAFAGVCVFMFFGMLDWLVTVHKNPEMRDVYFSSFVSSNMSIGGCSVYALSIWASISWTFWCLLRWFIHVLPEIMLHVLSFIFDTISPKMELYVDYVTYLEFYIRGILSWMVAYISWCSIFTKNPNWSGNDGNYNPSDYPFATVIQYLLLTVLMIYIIICFEKLLLQMFAISFHKMAYADRIRRSKNSVYVLERLNEIRFIGFSKRKNLASEKITKEEQKSAAGDEAALPSHAVNVDPHVETSHLDPIISDDESEEEEFDLSSPLARKLTEMNPQRRKTVRDPVRDEYDPANSGDNTAVASAATTPTLPPAVQSAPFEQVEEDRVLDTLQRHSNKGKAAQNFQTRMAELGNMMSAFGTRAAKAFDKTTAAIAKTAEQQQAIVLRSVADSKRLARKIFRALDWNNQGVLYIQTFEDVFDDKKEAKIAFSLFDQNHNGDVSPEEFTATFESIYKERVALGKSLRDSSQAITKLDSLFKVLAYIVLFFIILSIFQVNYKSFLAAAISLWVGMLFAVGPTVKTLLESVVFLFVTHPFDVGDRVDIDTDSYVVREFGIMTTTLRRVDGVEVYAPNALLSTKLIRNIRRSGHASEKLVVPVPISTPMEKIQKFQTILCDWLALNQRDYGPRTDVAIDKIVDKERMDLVFSVEYKSNNQDGAKQGLRRRVLLAYVRDAIHEAGLDMLYEQRLKVTVSPTDSEKTLLDQQVFSGEATASAFKSSHQGNATRLRH